MNCFATRYRGFFPVILLAVFSGWLALQCDVHAATIVRPAGSDGGLELLDGQGSPWLKDARAGLWAAGDPVVWTSDSRYQATSETQDNKTTLRFRDTQKQLDQVWTITALDDRCFTFELTVTNTSDKPLTLTRIYPLVGTFTEKHDADKPRVLLNGSSMNKPLPMALGATTNILQSSETIALESPSVAAGFLTGKHNSNRFAVKEPNGQPEFFARGECNGCLLMPGASRQTDLLFVSLHDNPLEQMERYADLAGKINHVKIWPPRVAWCTWYAGWMHAKMTTYKNGLEKGIEENIPYIQKYFASRGGLHTMRICDDYQMHGDWNNKTGRITGGFDRLARLISEAGIVPGVWYPTYWASTDSDVFKKHPDWFAMNKDGSTWMRVSKERPVQKPAPKKPADGKSKVTTSPESSGTPRTLKDLYNAPALAVFDTSRPEVQQYFEDAARTWRERGFRYVTNDYLGYATIPQKFYDPTMTKVEVMRAGLEAVRRGLGDDVFYRTISGPLGVRMGLANDVRISGDSHGDNPAAYFRTAQVWFYHRRLWLNDPSAVVCARYGNLKPIEWNRMWMSWIALSGTVMTYGESLEDLPEQYTRMYQRLFPPLPVAGRPLDIWENDPYLLWGMDPGEADGPYVLFGVFDVTGDGPRRVRLNLDEVAARCRGWDKPATAPGGYLLWDFWQQKLLLSESEKLELPLLAKSGQLFALRSNRGRPQLLGTSGHFSQGVVEAHDVVWDAAKNQLRGNVRGNGGDPSTFFFHLPKGMKPSGAKLDGATAEIRQPEPGVVAVDVPAVSEPVPLVLTFSGSPAEAAARTFVPGRAATRFDK